MVKYDPAKKIFGRAEQQALKIMAEIKDSNRSFLTQHLEQPFSFYMPKKCGELGQNYRVRAVFVAEVNPDNQQFRENSLGGKASEETYNHLSSLLLLT